MSRIKKSIREKRKRRIKTIYCGLLLTLMIGLAQATGTYALFTDALEIVSDLDISTGDIDVELKGKGFDINHTIEEDDDDRDDDSESYKINELSIVNEGTLNQNLSIYITPTIDNVNKDTIKSISKHINCNFKITNEKGDIVGVFKGKLSTLIDNKKDIKDKDGNLIILKPGEKLNINGNIVISEDIEDYYDILYDKTMQIELGVRSNQINKESIMELNGFYDVDTKNNCINFVIDDSLDVEFEDEDDDDDADCEHEAKGDKYEIEVDMPNNMEFAQIEIIGGTGQFKNIRLCREETDNDEFDIVKKDGSRFLVGHNGIGKEFSKKQMLKVKVIFGDNIAEYWDIQFRYEDGELFARYKVVEPPKEEVEVPSEPEVVEPPKEEVEVPNEPEVVEPPKEEVEVPSEPEVLEPPKEEVEVPSKPEVI